MGNFGLAFQFFTLVDFLLEPENIAEKNMLRLSITLKRVNLGLLLPFDIVVFHRRLFIFIRAAIIISLSSAISICIVFANFVIYFSL